MASLNITYSIGNYLSSSIVLRSFINAINADRYLLGLLSTLQFVTVGVLSFELFTPYLIDIQGSEEGAANDQG